MSFTSFSWSQAGVLFASSNKNTLKRLGWEQILTEVSSGSFTFLLCCLVLFDTVSPVLKHHFHNCDVWVAEGPQWCQTGVCNCQRMWSLQLSVAACFGHRLWEEGFDHCDALVLILCMNVRAYSVMKIVLCGMFFCNALKFLSDMQ